MSSDFSLSSVEVALSPLERFEEYLRTKGKRNTQPRRVIVEQIFSHHDHFDADELMAALARQSGDQKISRPTVYRALGELVDAGLLRKMELSGRAVYEHDYGYPQHDHLHCQACGKLIEFQSDEVQAIRDAVSQEHNFRATSHRLIITGVRSQCSRKRRRRNSPPDLI